MNLLDAIQIHRAEEQMRSEAWRREDPEPKPIRVVSTDGRQCITGCGKSIKRGTKGICRECWLRMSPKKRRAWLDAAQEAA
jgi:hypothetical protein